MHSFFSELVANGFGIPQLKPTCVGMQATASDGQMFVGPCCLLSRNAFLSFYQQLPPIKTALGALKHGVLPSGVIVKAISKGSWVRGVSVWSYDLEKHMQFQNSK